MNPEYKAALEEIEKLDTLNDEALAALWKIADHIPENWGDECRDGYVKLNISADAIEAVQAAICQKVSDIKPKPSDGFRDALLKIAHQKHLVRFNKVAMAICGIAVKALEDAKGNAINAANIQVRKAEEK